MNNAFLGAFRNLGAFRLVKIRGEVLAALCRHGTSKSAPAFLEHFFSLAASSRQHAIHQSSSVVRHASSGIQVVGSGIASFRIQKPSNGEISSLQRREFHAGFVCQSPRRKSQPQPSRSPQSLDTVQIPFKDFSGPELAKIFKLEVDKEKGNKVLRILHERRVTGALVDAGIKVEGAAEISWDASMNALKWLREKYPVDEQAAASDWASKEAKKLENQYVARAEQLGLYKKSPENAPVDAPRRADSRQPAPTASRPQSSVIDEYRRHHEQRRNKEAKELEASGRKAEEEKASSSRALALRQEREQAAEKRAKRAAEYNEYWQKKSGFIDSGDKIPEMSITRRLFPSTALGCVLITAFYLFAENYKPPQLSERLYGNYMPASVATNMTIIGINCFIFCAWRFGPAWRILNRYFLEIPGRPIALSMLGNVFSHQAPGHLFTNITGVLLFGISLHEFIGRGNFIALYLSGGVFGSVCSLWYYTLTKRMTYYHLGASGALWAVMGAWAYLTARQVRRSFRKHFYLTRRYSQPPRYSEQLYFYSDVARYCLLVLTFMGHFTTGITTKYDVAAHWGGLLAGLVSANFLKKRAEAKRKAASAAEERANAGEEMASEVRLEERKWEAKRAEEERKKTAQISYVKH